MFSGRTRALALPCRLLALSALLSALALLVYTDFRSCHQPSRVGGALSCPGEKGEESLLATLNFPNRIFSWEGPGATLGLMYELIPLLCIGLEVPHPSLALFWELSVAPSRCCQSICPNELQGTVRSGWAALGCAWADWTRRLAKPLI